MKQYAFLIAAMAATLCAQPPQPPTDAVKSYLNLSDGQIQTLEQIQQTERAALRSVHDRMRQAQDELRTASNGSDLASAGAAQAKVAALRKQIEESHASFRTQAAAALTADQKTKLSTLNDLSKMMPALHEAAQLGLLASPPRPDGPPPPPMQ